MRKIKKKNSRHVEAMCEILVSELKDELCRALHNSQEEECFEVDEIRKQVEEAFEMDDAEEFYEERDKHIQVKEIAEEMKKKARDNEEDVESKVELEREEKIELEDSAHESDWEKSEDENEHECGDSLDKIFDGQCCIQLC